MDGDFCVCFPMPRLVVAPVCARVRADELYVKLLLNPAVTCGWVETQADGWYQVVRDGDGARGLVPATYVDVEQF